MSMFLCSVCVNDSQMVQITDDLLEIDHLVVITDFVLHKGRNVMDPDSNQTVIRQVCEELGDRYYKITGHDQGKRRRSNFSVYEKP